MMKSFMLYVIAMAITLPVMVTWLVYKISAKTTKNPKKALHRAANWTAPLYIMAVAFMLGIIFDIHAAGYLLALLLAGFSAIIILQWKNGNEIKLGKALKFFFRIAFLVFFCCYAVLVVIGISSRIFI